MYAKPPVRSILEGATEYADCDGLLSSSGDNFPGTSVFEIAAAGVSLDKIVIGKPANSADANNGYMDASTLAGCVAQANQAGWSEYKFLLLSAQPLITPHCVRRRGHHGLGVPRR